MLMNMSSEDVLLIQYQMEMERTYLGQYLYGMKLHLKVIESCRGTPKHTPTKNYQLKPHSNLVSPTISDFPETSAPGDLQTPLNPTSLGRAEKSKSKTKSTYAINIQRTGSKYNSASMSL